MRQMEAWLTGQIPLIVWLQSLGPWLSLADAGR